MVEKTIKTICVKRRDEWGNYHDHVVGGNDIVAYIKVISLRPAPFGYRKTYIITNDGRAIWSTSSGAESYCGEVDDLEARILDMLKAGAVAYTYKFPRPVNPYIFKLQLSELDIEVEVEDYEGFKKVMPVLYSKMREYFKRYLNVELP
jgi:hypothetical protein